MIKKILCLLASMLMLLACSKEDKNKIYVGTNAEFEPFEYRDGQTIVGFDIDLIKAVADIIEKDVEIVDMSFDGLLPALQSKKIDLIIAGMTATDERKKFVNFTDPYYKSKQAILVSKDNTDINSIDDLKGKRVGVVLGFTGDLIASKIENANVQQFNATSESVLGLKFKKVDAVILDYEPAKAYANINDDIKLLDTKLEQEEYAIAIRKEDTELLEKINKAIVTIKENGTYDNLLKTYFEN